MTVISHPTNQPNFTMVEIGPLSLWFSYRTVIAFQTPARGIVVCENNWGATTGKHLNYIQPDKKRRVAYSKFQTQFSLVMESLNDWNPDEVSQEVL